jgi:hypothetical protein
MAIPEFEHDPAASKLHTLQEPEDGGVLMRRVIALTPSLPASLTVKVML